jgi:hypothetical protein
MTTMVLGYSTLKSQTPNVNAPSGHFIRHCRKWERQPSAGFTFGLVSFTCNVTQQWKACLRCESIVRNTSMSNNVLEQALEQTRSWPLDEAWLVAHCTRLVTVHSIQKEGWRIEPSSQCDSAGGQVPNWHFEIRSREPTPLGSPSDCLPGKNRPPRAHCLLEKRNRQLPGCIISSPAADFAKELKVCAKFTPPTLLIHTSLLYTQNIPQDCAWPSCFWETWVGKE